MRKEIKRFIKICKKDQDILKSYLYDRLREFGYDVISTDGFLYAKGSAIMLTAHMDTVHEKVVKDVNVEKVSAFESRVTKPKNDKVVSMYKWSKNSTEPTYDLKGKDPNNTVISSPQGIGGDDRCGVYMILEILKRGYRPTILFCEDEEIGGVGSNKFCKSEYAKELDSLKYILELDRMNADDAVYYDCGNKEFQNYIEKMTGFKENWGSFSDISHLSPEGDVASVNLSCGYYKQHTLEEYVIFEEMENTIDMVEVLLKDEENAEQYDYQEITFYGKYDYSYEGYDYASSWRDDEWGIVYTKDDEVNVDYVFATSNYEAIGKFLVKHDDLTYNSIIEADFSDVIDYNYCVDRNGYFDDDYESSFEAANKAILAEVANN